jgi:hypothetical protein
LRSGGRTDDAVVRQAIQLASGFLLAGCNGLEPRGAVWDPGEGTTGGTLPAGESGGPSSDGGEDESDSSSGSNETLPEPTSNGETTGWRGRRLHAGVANDLDRIAVRSGW